MGGEVGLSVMNRQLSCGLVISGQGSEGGHRHWIFHADH